MMKEKTIDNHTRIKNIVLCAILASIVIVLQLFLGSIKLGPVSVSFVLIPIAFGAIILGPWGGAILGAVFGLIVLVNGFLGRDVFTLFLLSRVPIATILTCMIKGILAGLIPALVVKWLNKSKLSIVLASVLTPVINTLVFALMVVLFMNGAIQEFIGEYNLDAQSTLYFVVIVCAGYNFLAEFAANAIISPSLYTVIKKIVR